MRKGGAVGAAIAAVAGVAFAATPATAAPATATAYPTSTFEIPYGASYYNGTVTWFNRSVGVDGNFKAVGCHRVYGQAWAGNTELDYQSSSTHCDYANVQPIPLDANVAGGATEVYVWMTDAKGIFQFGNICYRGVAKCVQDFG